MELETNKLCDFVCSAEFKCHWEKLEQKVRYMFPDGTSQSCVGAQVRCGCTFTMRLISNVTYEHPTAVTLSFIFISTIVLYMILRCVILQNACPIFCCAPAKPKPKTCLACSLPTPRDSAISAHNLSNGSSSSHHSASPAPDQHSVFVVYTDKPPTYSKVVSEQEACCYMEAPPPSYSECLKCDDAIGAVNHI